MKKKGSHVGMMLSFVIFIGFLIFVYTILGPSLQVERGKQSILDYLKVELINQKFSSNLTISSIKISESTTLDKDCFQINNIIENPELIPIVQNTDDNLVNSKRNENKLLIENTGESFFKILYSKYFEENGNLDNCKSLDEGDYVLGRIKTEIFVYGPFIIQFLEDMKDKEKYEKIKSELHLPNGTEFGMSFKQGKEINEANMKEVSTNIYVEEIPIQYFDTKGNINSGFLTIKVW